MIGIIADDISGAAEVGGVCRRFGFETQVYREANRLGSPAEVTVIDTDSRSLSASESARRVRRAAEWLRQFKPEWCYKKVDSVLRGNVYHEIVAMGESLGLARALLVPANPSLGRVIRDGVYYVDDIPVDETDFANDPEHPVGCSDVVEMLGKSASWPVVSGGRASVLPDRGILIGDVNDEEDLAGWAAMAAEYPVVSAGGSEFLVALMEERGRKSKESPWLYNREERNLWISGSAASRSQERVRRARRLGIPVMSMPPPLMRTGDHENSAILDWADSVAESLSRFPQVIVTIGQPVSPEPELPARLGRYLGRLTMLVRQRISVDHLWLEGGATASAVLRELGWEKLTVVREIRLGVVTMRPSGQTRPAVTVKPGSYEWPGGIWQPR